LFAAVGLVGLASTACAEQSAAIKVGDDTVSESDLTDEIDTLSGNEALLQLIVSDQVTRDDIVGQMGEDSYTQPFVAYMIEQRVFLLLQSQLAEQEGIEPSKADREEVRGQIDDELANAGVDTDDLPDEYVDQLVDQISLSQALQQGLGQDEFQAKFLELAEKTDVELSSRFGEWDNDAFLARLQGQQAAAVTPPPAPLSPEAGADPGLPAG
jgi:hypothetical protein